MGLNKIIYLSRTCRCYQKWRPVWNLIVFLWDQKRKTSLMWLHLPAEVHCQATEGNAEVISVLKFWETRQRTASLDYKGNVETFLELNQSLIKNPVVVACDKQSSLRILIVSVVRSPLQQLCEHVILSIMVSFYCCFLQTDRGWVVQPGTGETKKCRSGGSVADKLLSPAPHCDECQPLREATGSNEGMHHCFTHC